MPRFFGRASRRMKTVKRYKKGLTILEISFVIVILSVIFIIVFSVMNTMIVLHRSVNEKKENIGTALQVMQELRYFLNQSFYHNVLGNTVLFVGKKKGSDGDARDWLAFASVFPGAEDLGLPAVRELTYYIKEEDDGSYSLLRREDSLVDDQPGMGGLHKTLLRNILSFQIRYSDNLQTAASAWKSGWDSRTSRSIPKYIRVQCRFSIKGREETLEILAQPGMRFF